MVNVVVIAIGTLKIYLIREPTVKAYLSSADGYALHLNLTECFLDGVNMGFVNYGHPKQREKINE